MGQIAKILDGRELSRIIRHQVSARLQEWLKESSRAVRPRLAVVLVGEDPASQIYVKNKMAACKDVGMESVDIRLPMDCSKKKLYEALVELNNDINIHGVLVQFPLPMGFSQDEVLSWVSPLKDVDALTIENVGLMYSGQARVVPCTPNGIIKLLEHYNICLEGQNAVVIGRSLIVGQPMAHLLQQKGCTVTLCHSKTKNLQEHSKRADILVVAMGQAESITGDYIKPGAVVIDVGIHKKNSSSKKLCGDVEFESAQLKASYITPVPGGVGPLTIAQLIENTFYLTKNSCENVVLRG